MYTPVNPSLTIQVGCKLRGHVSMACWWQTCRELMSAQPRRKDQQGCVVPHILTALNLV